MFWCSTIYRKPDYSRIAMPCRDRTLLFHNFNRHLTATRMFLKIRDNYYRHHIIRRSKSAISWSLHWFSPVSLHSHLSFWSCSFCFERKTIFVYSFSSFCFVKIIVVVLNILPTFCILEKRLVLDCVLSHGLVTV